MTSRPPPRTRSTRSRCSVSTSRNSMSARPSRRNQRRDGVRGQPCAVPARPRTQGDKLRHDTPCPRAGSWWGQAQAKGLMEPAHTGVTQ